MIGFYYLDSPQRLAGGPGRVPAADYQPASQPVAELSLHRGRNRHAGLARPQYQYGTQAAEVEVVAVRGKRAALYVHETVDGSGRTRRPNTRGDDIKGEPAEIPQAMIEQRAAI